MTIQHEYQLNKGEAVKRLNPDIQFKVSNIGTDDEVIEYLDPSQTPPSHQAIAAELKKMKQEFVWAAVRAKRDSMLRDSDKVMLPDYPIQDPKLKAWENYRQELRNIPQTFSDDVTKVEYPNEPS
jgi:hypothetical protein